MERPNRLLVLLKICIEPFRLRQGGFREEFKNTVDLPCPSAESISADI